MTTPMLVQDNADDPRADFIGDPRAGLFYHPAVVDGVRPGDRLANGPGSRQPGITFRLSG